MYFIPLAACPNDNCKIYPFSNKEACYIDTLVYAHFF